MEGDLRIALEFDKLEIDLSQEGMREEVFERSHVGEFLSRGKYMTKRSTALGLTKIVGLCK